MSSRRWIIVAAASIAAAFALPRHAAAQSDVVRGRVTGPDSLPVERANITVTSLSGNVSRVARTDKAGRFTVTFPGEDGDYFVNIAALGFAAKRFEVKRTGDQEVLVADARLTRVATELGPVKVQADRQKASRNDLASDLSGSERGVNGSAVSADQLGDLAAMAASLPGVQLVPSADGGPNGFSVLGLTPDQNATTLNGLSFGGSNLPRDANVSTSVITTPYDVSRGNFSGGLLSLRSRPGSNFIARSMSYNADAPQLQWTDARARALGQQYGSLSAGGALSGPIQFDQSFYLIAYQAGRRANDLQTLLNTDPLGLETAGISQDSVTRLTQILQSQHVPTSTGGIPSSRFSDNASLYGTLDWAPPTSTTGQAFNVTFNGSWNRQDPSGAQTTELPSHLGERTNWSGSVQGKHSSYFGFGILSETQVGVNRNSFFGTPFVVLPNGTVRVTSTFTDAPASVQSLSFGGSPSMNTAQSATTVQGINTLSWFSENNKHKLKLTTELRRDAYSQDLSSNELGTFSFNSLADLQAGVPAIFTRQLSSSRRSEAQYVAGTSLGDTYRPTDGLQIQYGVRLDGNHFNGGPVNNPLVEQTFNLRNDGVPNHVYASPRVGFSWVYGSGQLGAFDGAVRGPRAVVRGGIGIFQNTLGATSIGSAMDNTGLPSAVQQIACVGIAAPTPNWVAYAANPASTPTQCADGTSGTVFSNTSPNVNLFDPKFAAPRALRSNLQWSGATLGNRLATTIDGTYSLNLDQTSTFDLNFAPTQQFALASEGNRPVYARAAAIVPTTGAIGAGEARVSSDFAHVNELRSDMESDARQLTLQVRPMSFNSTYSWSLSYVYSNARERYRGFTSTAGNPLDATWGRSSFDSRHQIIYSLTYNAMNFVTLSWYGSFRSGLPYTPLVAGDINGDGYTFNDRAFIFDPSKTADSALTTGMRSLLANGSSSARDCLTRQLNEIATRNSCEGPWSSTANLTMSFNPAKVRLPQRATLSFQVSNPLGAVDALMHGPSNLHGWGQTFIPTSQLLFVRGFDPTTDRYKYEVNQRFGATALSQTTTRLPVTLTTMLRVDVGPTRERQGLTQMLDRGRASPGTKVPEMMFKAMYGNGGVINPMVTILRQADTLELTAQQADSIAVLNRGYTISLDSIWSPAAKYFASLPQTYDQGEAYDRYRMSREASVDALIAIAPKVKGLLTPAQQRMLPAFITQFLDTRYLASVRSGTAGTGLGMIMLPGGLALPAGIGAGGGVRIEIQRP